MDAPELPLTPAQAQANGNVGVSPRQHPGGCSTSKKREWLHNSIMSCEVVPNFQRPVSPLRPTRRHPPAPLPSLLLPSLLPAAPPKQPQRPGELEVVAPFHSGSRTASPSPTHSSHGQGDPRFSGQNMKKASLDELIVGSDLDGDDQSFASLREWERLYND